VAEVFLFGNLYAYTTKHESAWKALLRRRFDMYLSHWKLNKHPFNNVPDPDMYFQAHHHVDEAVSEVLFAIEEADECLAVVVGPVGVGKSMCLRVVLDALDPAKYRCAFVTNPDMTFSQLLREIIGQLQDRECTEVHKEKLLEMFNRNLFETNNTGRRVVIFIDEGNVIKPVNLESLRLLTNMQDDHQNLLTIVLAGQPELGRRLEDPRRANLFQRIGVYCQIQGITTRELMKDYIEHRLERAGWSGESMFTEQAYDELWSLSENGVPRIINKMCKLALKAGETNKLSRIDADIIRAVGESFQRVWRKVKTNRKPAPIPEENKEEEHEAEAVVLSANLPVHAPDAEPKAPVKEETEYRFIPPIQAPGAVAAADKMPEIIKLHGEDNEKLAERLATERLNQLTDITDPFEEWNKAREEILKEITLAGGSLPGRNVAV